MCSYAIPIILQFVLENSDPTLPSQQRCQSALWTDAAADDRGSSVKSIHLCLLFRLLVAVGMRRHHHSHVIRAAFVIFAISGCAVGSGIPQYSGPLLPLQDHTICGDGCCGKLLANDAQPKLGREGVSLTLVLRGGSSIRRAAPARGRPAAVVHTPLETAIGKVVSAIQGVLNSILSLYHQLFLDPLLDLVMGGDRVDQVSLAICLLAWCEY